MANPRDGRTERGDIEPWDIGKYDRPSPFDELGRSPATEDEIDVRDGPATDEARRTSHDRERGRPERP